MWVVTLLGLRDTANITIAALEKPGSADIHVLRVLIYVSEENTVSHSIVFFGKGVYFTTQRQMVG
jgi:hypothetical protein